jgi:hypothetical protein
MVFALAAPSAGDAFLALAVYDSTDPTSRPLRKLIRTGAGSMMIDLPVCDAPKSRRSATDYANKALELLDRPPSFEKAAGVRFRLLLEKSMMLRASGKHSAVVDCLLQISTSAGPTQRKVRELISRQARRRNPKTNERAPRIPI